MTRIVVCDTGPLLHLSEAGAIHLLALAGNIFVPPMVASEFEDNTQGWKPPQWIKVVQLKNRAKAQAEAWIQSKKIDAGEAQAICLALQLGAAWLLTDDARARQLAESQRIEAHGSIGLLLWSVASNHVSDAEEAQRLLANLAHSSLWLSKRVLQEAQRAIAALLEAGKK